MTGVTGQAIAPALARLKAVALLSGGLDVGGRTPAEIAVSIMAELLAVRYGRTGGCALGKRRSTKLESLP